MNFIFVKFVVLRISKLSMGKIAENISKDLELAVFEKDSFTCQKCGRKVPNVVLLVLYKKSPECGGNDAISNLITWCHECAEAHDIIGMQNIKREQLEMFFHWKQIGNDYSDDELRMLIEYINQKIRPWHWVNKTGEKKIRKEMRLNNITDIIDVIDEAFESSIEYENDKITKDSAEDFINNIPRYLTVKRKGPVAQKILYIRGICRNSFNYCNEHIALELLQEYVQALKDYGYDEEALMNDLTKYLQPETIKCKNWSQWKAMMEQWTSDVRDWIRQKNESASEEKTVSDEDIRIFSFHDCEDVISRIELLLFLHKVFPKCTKAKQIKLAKDIYRNTYEFLSDQKKLFLDMRKKNKQGVNDLIESYSANLDASEYFYSEGYDENLTCKLSFGARYIITEEVFYTTIENILHSLNYAKRDYDFPCTIKFIDLAMQTCANKYHSIK